MNDMSATPLHYSARPALTLDGARQAALEQGLISLAVEETAEGLAHAELCFGNWGAARGAVDFLYMDRAVLEFGRKIGVEIGAGDAGGAISAGRITALEGRFPKSRPPEIIALAEDRFQDLRMTRRSRTFEDADLAAIAQAIASDHGMTAEVDAEGPALEVVSQLNLSDLAFLRDRAREAGAEVWAEGDVLHVKARARRGEDPAVLTYGRNLQELAVTADLAGQCTALTVSGWDAEAREGLTAEAGADALGAENAGQSGAEALEAAFGARPDQIAHALPLTQTEADAFAAARFRARARRFLRGEAIAEGDARLRVGRGVTLKGCGPLFDGAYTVTHARHEFSLDAGLVSRIGIERPWIGGAR